MRSIKITQREAKVLLDIYIRRSKAEFTGAAEFVAVVHKIFPVSAVVGVMESILDTAFKESWTLKELTDKLNDI